MAIEKKKLDEIQLKVLIVDDEPDHVEGLRTRAREMNIQLVHKTNFKDGLDELTKEFHTYNGVILDAKCFLDKEAEEKKELTDDNIDATIQKVKALSEEQGYIPHCVLTGYSKNFRNRLQAQGFKVFSKPEENEASLNFIRKENELENKYIYEYKDLMELFRMKFLNPKFLKRISNSLDNKGSDDIDDVKQAASVTRDVLEDYFDLLVKMKILTPEIRTSSVNDIAMFLVHKKEDSKGVKIEVKYIFDDYLSWCVSYLHASSSFYLHNNQKSSKHITESLMSSLFEILDYFRIKTVPIINKRL